MNDLHQLKIECLRGGNIVQVNSLEQALIAERAGAAGVFVDLPTPEETAALYQDLIGKVSVHLVCQEHNLDSFRPAYDERYGSEGPGFLILSDLDSPTDDYPNLTYVKDANELERAIEQEALLIVCDDFGFLPEAKSALAETGIPLYFEVDDIDDCIHAAKQGIDGLIMKFLPTSRQMESIWSHTFPPSVIETGEYTIGVLGLQGDYQLHKKELEDAIEELGFNAKVVLARTEDDIDQVDALVLPGGWSNLQSRMYEYLGLDENIRQFKKEGKPILAVCAGMVLAGTHPGNYCEGRNLLSLMGVKIENNVLTGERTVVSSDGKTRFSAVFSDAPIIDAPGPVVDVIAQLETGEIVAAKQDNVFVYAFHKGPHEDFVRYCMNPS